MATQHRRSRIQFLATVAVVCIAGSALGADGAAAWPGDPDGAFGACGARSFDVVAGTASGARAAALTEDGKTLVAGWADDRGLVMRLTGGDEDPTFGTAGRTRIKLNGATRYEAVAATAAGGVVAAGRRTVGDVVDSTIVRLNAAGMADTTFHTNGRWTFNAGGNDLARAVVALDDGSVMVAGDADAGGYVAVYTNAGTPDTGWDGDGRRSGLPILVRSMVRRADGTVYVGGTTISSPGDWRVLRLNPDGSTDNSFGGTSGMTVDAGGHDVITALALQPNGALLATGFGTGAAGHGQTMVRRYLPDATVDPSFTPYRESFGVSDSPTAIFRESAGAIVVGGNSRVGSDNDIVVVRLQDDGDPDLGFGIDGATVSDAGTRSSLNGIVVPASGRPLGVGTRRLAGRDVVGVFRFQADSSTAAAPVQGLVADAYGGIHGWSAGCTTPPGGFVGGPYWLGQDLVRGVAVLPGNRGLMVDAFGGAHGFTFGDAPASSKPVARSTPYWLGWDIVRGIAIVPEGTGGYELDAYGGLHRFSIGSGAMPPALSGTPYWPGVDRARGVALMPDGNGGYVVDAAGIIYRFGGAPVPNPGGPSWPGQDIVRGIVIAPDGSGGWLLDRSGGVHPFGTGGDAMPPAAVGGPYWAGAALARGVAVLP